MIHESEVSAIVIVGQDRNKTNSSCVHIVALRQHCWVGWSTTKCGCIIMTAKVIMLILLKIIVLDLYAINGG